MQIVFDRTNREKFSDVSQDGNHLGDFIYQILIIEIL